VLEAVPNYISLTIFLSLFIFHIYSTPSHSLVDSEETEQMGDSLSFLFLCLHANELYVFASYDFMILC